MSVQKKLRRNLSFFVCPEQDSNLHTVTGTTPSKWRVYQFHHLGLRAANVRQFS